MNILYNTIPVIAKDLNLKEWDIMLLLDILESKPIYEMEWKMIYSSIGKLKELGYILSGSEEQIIGNIKKLRELFSKYEVKICSTIGISDTDCTLWIQEYRNIFKGKCKHAVPMGNKDSCITRMKWFNKKYPEYNKDIILKATILGIETIRQKYGENLIPQADNFIVTENYKTGGGFPIVGKLYSPGKEYLCNYCEIVTDMIAEGKEVKSSNINPKYIKSI